MAVEIFSATGGNGLGFSRNNVTGTQVQWNVPTTSFDIYMRSPEGLRSFSRTYTGTTTQPDGLYEITLAEMQAVGSWPADYEGQIYVRFEPESGGFVETNVSIRDTTPLNAANLDTYIEQWWEREVKPELEAINTTLQSILTQQTTIATQLTPVTDEAQGEVLADQIARIRYLADPDATEADSDGNHGTGIRQSNPWSTVINALTFEGLIQEGNILGTVGSEINDQTLQTFLDRIANRNNDQVITQAEQRLDNLVSAFRSNSTFNNYK